MEKILIIINKIKSLISSIELDLSNEKVINELINQIKIIGLDLNDLINWYSCVVLKNNNIQTVAFIKDKKRLEIYWNEGYHIDYIDENKEIKSTFNLSKINDLSLRKVMVLVHCEKDYLFNIENDFNFYGQAFSDGLGVMNTSIRCFDEKIDLNDAGFEHSNFNNIDFVIPSNYSIDDLIKLIRIFEKNPSITMQHINEIMNNSDIAKTINYVSYNASRDFKFSNGKYHIDLHTLPISQATTNGGKIYEVDEKDLEYFRKSKIIDYDQFTPWRYQKERKRGK